MNPGRSGVQERPPQSRFGALIEQARGTRKVRPLALDAGISEARWRQIEKGSQPVGGGVYVPAHPTARTVRLMAEAVGVDVAEAMEAAGIEDTTPDTQQRLTTFEAQSGSVRVLIAALADDDLDEATKQDMVDAALAAYRAFKRGRA
jgi:hypothetical protein